MPQKKTTQAASAAPQKDSMSQEEEIAAMQEQFKFQLKALLKSAAAAGVDIKDIYEPPPVANTVVLDAAQLIEAIKEAAKSGSNVVSNPTLKDLGAPVNAPNLKPGQLIPGTQNWRPWTKQDLDPEDMVEFVPLPVPSLLYPMVDDLGRQKIRLDINNLGVWFTVGEVTRVNRFYWNPYNDAYLQWKELENFKRFGPIGAPWGNGEPGNPAWKYIPFAPSFGMTEEGRSLRIGPPTALDYIAGVETPTAPTEEG